MIALQEQQECSQGYNDCYVEMQSLHTSISTLTSHVTGLPSVRQVGHMIVSGNHLLQTSETFELHYLTPQIKAQKIIEELTSDAECVTKALGQTIFSLFNIFSKFWECLIVDLQLNLIICQVRRLRKRLIRT